MIRKMLSFITIEFGSARSISPELHPFCIVPGRRYELRLFSDGIECKNWTDGKKVEEVG